MKSVHETEGYEVSEGIRLSPDQVAAVDRIANWFLTVRREVDFCDGGDGTSGEYPEETGYSENPEKCPNTPHTHVCDVFGDGPAISLGGLAGSGKTSVMRHLGDILTRKGVRLLYAAPTNKAAGVLRGKLPEESRGLVSTTYAISYFPDPKDKCKTSNRFVKEIPRPCECSSPPEDCTCPRIFEPCGAHPDPCKIFDHLEWVKRPYVRGHAHLLIVDESSMLSQEQVEDILAFGLPVVLVGDHGQLPPVQAAMNRWIARPDIVLTENHRQKNDTSGIVDLALWARQGIQLRKGVWGDGRTVVMDKSDERIGALLDVDRYRSRNPDAATWPQIITYTNALRSGINQRFHGNGGVRSGDRVVCLQKCVVPVVDRVKEDGSLVPRMRSVITVGEDGKPQGEELVQGRTTVHNGGTGTVVRVLDSDGLRLRMLVCLDGSGTLVEVDRCEVRQFGAEKTLAKNERGKNSRLWDYAYAITCHRAQGSEWDEVIVLDDSHRDRDRWRYTAITRARQKLVVVCMKD